MRQVCFQNIPPHTLAELLNLFSKWGDVQCFPIRHTSRQTLAFVCFQNEDAGQVAIDHFNNQNLGDGTMTAGWATKECNRRHDSTPSKMSPSKTLFVFNFDLINTTRTDLETYFNKYGEIVDVRFRHDFALVEFARQEDATRALEGAHMSLFGDRLLKVDYSKSVPNSTRPRGSRSPVTHRSPNSRYRGRRSRSRGPVTRRSRGHSRSRSPVARRSRNYHRYHGRSRSRSPVTRRSRGHSRSRSRVARRSRNYDSYHGHSRSRSPVTRRSRGHSRSRSPVARRSRNYHRYHGRSRSRSPVTRRSRSPVTRGRRNYYRYHGRSRSRSPVTRKSRGHSRSRSPVTRGSRNYDR